MKRGGLLILSAVALVACSPPPPPCSTSDEGSDDIGPVPAPAPPPGPGGPGTPDHSADADGDYGYSRTAEGEVCSCNARDAELRGCTTDPPPDCDPQRGYNIETGECAPPITDQPVQDSKHYCGDVFWCCYEFRCLSTDPKAKRDVPEMFICPTMHGSADKTRAGAWKIWDYSYLTPALKALQAEFGDCWKRAGSCYETPPITCGNYPN